MNATTATRNTRMKGTANIVKASVNVAFLHALRSPSLELSPKLEPAQVALESLPKYLQDHIAGHTATMLNLFDDVNTNTLESPISKKLNMKTI